MSPEQFHKLPGLCSGYLQEFTANAAIEIATILSRKHHNVHVLSPPGFTLTKLTSHVSKVHTVPPFGSDPYAWFKACIAILSSEKEKFDIILCTQEQVAILSAEKSTIEKLGVQLAVPEFSSLTKVLGKLEAVQTLRDAGLPQPESAVILSQAAASNCAHLLPGFLKTCIGTASQGVRCVKSLSGLETALVSLRTQGLLDSDKGEKLLLQKEVSGSLLMVCGVFAKGKLLAWHACVRLHQGPNGSATKKMALPLPIVGKHLALLGQYLNWHGALSLDAILHDGDPFYIDVNPRIVEPMNGLLSGVDLVQNLIDISLKPDFPVTGSPKQGTQDAESHQLVLALLGKAEEGRIMVAIEFFTAVMNFGRYRGSMEELTPMKGDLWSLVVLIVILILLLLGGKGMAQRLGTGAVKGYALSGKGWRKIREREDNKRPSNS
jgi:hypothetical protein